MNPPSKSNKLQPKRKFTTTDTLLRQSVPSSKLRKPCPLPYTPSSTPMPSSNLCIPCPPPYTPLSTQVPSSKLCKPCPPPYTPFPRPFYPSMPLLAPSSTQGISTTLPSNSSSTHMRSVVPVPPSKPSSQVPSSESPATQSYVPAATQSSQVLSSIPATKTTRSSVPVATRSSVPAATRSSVPAATRSFVPAATRSATQSYIPATQSAAAEVPSSVVDTQSYIPATQSSGAATQSYIPATQSAAAEVPLSVVDTESGRKRNKLKNVAKRMAPVQVKVNTNGEPDGEGDTGAHTFWAWQSWLLKNHMRYPLTAANHWKLYPMNLKEKLWREMEEKWILEGLNQEIFYKKAGGALRQIRKSYRKNYFYRNINCDWSDPLKYLPPDFPPEQWRVLVNQWSDPQYVDIAEKNLDNRVENPHPNHHMGSTGYPALASKMISEAELENRALPDDFDIWVKGVTNKKGEVDDASQTIINRFNEKVIEFMNEDESTPESQHPTSTPRERAWDFVNDERNSAKHGYRLGKGSGPTITMLLGGRKMQKFVNEEVLRKLTATEHELAANQVKLKETQDKMARMEAFLEKKFGYIDGSSTS